MININNNLFQCNTQKLCLISHLLRKQTVRAAVVYLEFCKKKTSKYLYCVILSELYKKRNTQKLNLEKLYIKEIKVYKSFSLKRFMVRAKGKINRITKPYSKVGLILEFRC